MKRTTVMLPDELLARLRHEARQRGVSVAEIVREAVLRHVREPPGARSLSFVGIYDGPTVGAANIDEVVAEAIVERLSRRS